VINVTSLHHQEKELSVKSTIMEITTAKKTGSGYINKGIGYDAYRELVDDLLTAGRVTGPQQSEALLGYTKLNVQRMRRIDKTIELLPETKKAMEVIRTPQTWLVLTEGWCGDAAQVLPVLNAMAKENPLVSLKLLLRDENPELMDQYLTDGVSRSIPKLVIIDSGTLEERFNWGPRPAILQRLFREWKESGIPFNEVKENMHTWYARDKTVSTQLELGALLQGDLSQ
jgi:hypothetical protein